MRKLLPLVAMQSLFFSSLSATCPSPIEPLPALDIPIPVPPPVATCSTPAPDSVTGYMPFTFVNNTGIDASDIYICVLVNSSTQYLSFAVSSGHYLATISDFMATTYINNTPAGAPTYTYPLSSFELIDTDTYTFYIPNDGNTADPSSNIMKSSRILISLNEPLTYFINNTGLLQLPSEFDATNDNYFILNDKIEFDIGSNNLNRMNLNLTGVDFFGLPMLVQINYQFFFGSSYTNACGKTGMPADISLNDVFTQYSAALDTLSPPFDEYWEGLVATYTNPDSSVSKLRIYAPATAMGSTQTQSNPSPVTFPTNYFLNTASSPNSCTWFEGVWKGKTKSGKIAYYQNRKPIPYLILDATTASGAATAKGYEVEDGSFKFTISGGPDKGKTLSFPFPTSSKAFFTGAVSDYEPAITGGVSAATSAQVFKVFATSIIGGFFPINCKTNSPFTINNTYVQNNSADYFENNALLTTALNTCECVANVPWYDFYSRALLTIGTPNLFYTSAYSDFLGSDGTIVVVNLATNNADATITVNLNDCSTGITAPDPYSDTTTYTTTVALPGSGVTAQYGPSASGPWNAIVNPISVQGDQFFLRVTYTSGVYIGTTIVTQIAPAARIFHPILPGQGAITTTGTTCTVALGQSPSS